MNALLIIIGASLFGLSVVLILLGSFYSKKNPTEFSAAYKTVPNVYSVIPFRLQFDSEVNGEISVTTGELEWSLEDYFGWIPKSPLKWINPAYDRWEGHGEHKFRASLKAGDYTFTLKTKAQSVEAKLKWTITDYIYYLKRLVDLGLVFVEVSVPLLVTGLVI